MADHDVLTHAFLAGHPEDAARVLEQLSAEDAAALFESVPVRLCSPVLAAMLPYSAARCLRPLDKSRGAMLLGAISIPGAAAVLRNLPEGRRNALLEALPTATTLACRALLGYPEDSVGGCVDTEIIALPPDARVEDATEAVRGARAVPTGPVYVVDAQRRPLGQIELTTLLRAGSRDRLDALMHAVPVTLPAVTPLAGASAHPVWHDADIVAVVERGGGLVGVVRRSALHRAQRRRHKDSELLADSMTGVFALGYWHAVSSLIDATLALLAPPPRGRP